MGFAEFDYPFCLAFALNALILSFKTGDKFNGWLYVVSFKNHPPTFQVVLSVDRVEILTSIVFNPWSKSTVSIFK